MRVSAIIMELRTSNDEKSERIIYEASVYLLPLRSAKRISFGESECRESSSYYGAPYEP